MVHQLWHGKTYIPQQFRDLLAQGNPKEAYRGSLEDSKRDWLTTEELCSFTWEWRFKAVAGEHFTEDDPWYSSLPPRTRKYHPDGRVSGPYAGPSTRWRFVKSAEGKLGPHGKFFRVWNTPAAVVGRHPGHWGFFAQSCWHLTTAWPMPKRGEDPLMDDENLKVTTESQIYEVLCCEFFLFLPFYVPCSPKSHALLAPLPDNGGIDYRDTEIMNRRGFERACKRAGFNVHEVLRFHDDEDSDEEEEGIEFVVVEDGDQVDEEGDEESGDEDDNSNSDDGLGSDVQSLDEDEVEALLREAGSDAEGSD